MNTIAQETTVPETDEPIDLCELAREQCLATRPEEMSADEFPELTSISPRFFYRFLPIPDESPPVPEYVYVPTAEDCGLMDDERYRYELFISDWNNTWEAGAWRSAKLDFRGPDRLRWVIERKANVRLVSRVAAHSYDAFVPLYHLLPRGTLERFGLPPLRRGIWPHLRQDHLLGHVLPADFDGRLEEAITYHLWPLLGARGAPSCFSSSDPIRMLSHNLDYWLPYIDIVVQTRMRGFRRTEMEGDSERADYLAHKDQMPPGVTLQTPLRGGTLWLGEQEVMEATRQMVEVADAHGDLRAILDAVRSHRIKDDFSERWSFEREDFERKLYSKRSKAKVTFVELDETVPVHGPQSEVHENLLWEDFISLLDIKERRIVVCLRNGVTRLAEIAEALGYASHSPISKHLAKIRDRAKRLLEMS